MQDHHLVSSLKRFFTGTLLSRLTGFGREVAMAAAFGVIPAVSAFWMAFRFAHLLRRLFGEGGLHVAFIPHFESLKKKDPEEAAIFFYQLTTFLTRFLLILFLCLEAVMAFFLWRDKGDSLEVIKLTMILLPSLLFICLYALNQALLNCEGSYFLPSVAPSFLNLMWIGTVIVLWNQEAHFAMEILAMVVVFAFGVQWIATMPPVYKYLQTNISSAFWLAKEKKEKKIFHLLKPLAFGLIGVTATQINSGLDTFFARIAEIDGPAILWYAIRIQQLPLALLGVGMMGALLPAISRAVETNEESRSLQLLHFASKRIGALMLPIMGGLFALGFVGINLAYGRGAFTPEATVKTTLCLWGYGLGLLPMSLVLIFASYFYAKKNYKTPTVATLASIGVNLLLNAFFVFVLKMGALSIALATSFAAFVNAGLLLFFLIKRADFSFKALMPSMAKVFFASLIGVLITVFVSAYLFNDQTLFWLKGLPLPSFQRKFSSQVLFFILQTALFGGGMWLGAFLCKCEEILELIAFRKKKLKI